ncbi:hypothetical protein ACXZ1M_16805 [Duganella sp. PWIR1]
MRIPTLLMVATLLAASCAAAQNAPSVTVKATRDPVDKSYRKMIAGMEIFERHRALAPQATLRFQLLPRLPDTQLDGITCAWPATPSRCRCRWRPITPSRWNATSRR